MRSLKEIRESNKNLNNIEDNHVKLHIEIYNREKEFFEKVIKTNSQNKLRRYFEECAQYIHKMKRGKYMYVYQLKGIVLEHTTNFTKEELTQMVKQAKEMQKDFVLSNEDYDHFDMSNESEVLALILHIEFGFDIVDSTIIM